MRVAESGSLRRLLGARIDRADCPLLEKRGVLAIRKKYFSVHHVAARCVSKRSMDVFKRFNDERFSVAACNNCFWWARDRRTTQKFRDNSLAIRKNEA
jgi:hypothetical protein